MRHPVQLFIDSLRIEFLHITTYKLDYRWRIANRSLPQCVLWHIRSGRIRVAVDDYSCEARSGGLLFLPAGSSLSAYALSTELELVSLNFAAAVGFMPNRPWNELLKFPVDLGETPAEAESLLGELLALDERQSLARSILQQAGLIRLIGLLVDRHLPASPADVPLSADPRVNQAIAYITGDSARMPSVGELADLVRLSESHLRKLFLEHVGMPPQSFILRIKMEQAKRLLAEGGERISDIADRLGFRDPNYFTRQFRQHTGMSPKRYRDQTRPWLGTSAETVPDGMA